MPRAKKTEEVVETPEVVEEVVETHSASSKDTTVVRYRDHQGVTVDRTYSKEVHGADHAKLAKQFAEKKNGTIV